MRIPREKALSAKSSIQIIWVRTSPSQHPWVKTFTLLQPLLRGKLSRSWMTPTMLHLKELTSTRRSSLLLRKKLPQRWKREGQTFWIRQDGCLTRLLRPTLASLHSTPTVKETSTQQLVELTTVTTCWRTISMLSAVKTHHFTSRSTIRPLSQALSKPRACESPLSLFRNLHIKLVNRL